MMSFDIGRVTSITFSPVQGKDAKWRTLTIRTQDGQTLRLTVFPESRELVHTQLMIKEE